MPTFEYKARDPSGKKIQGRMAAENASALADKLIGLGYLVTSVSEYKKSNLFSFDLFSSFSKVKINELVMFYLQLASMIGAGITLPAGLEVLVQQIENKKLKDASAAILKDIQEGATFSEAISRQLHIFSTITVNMIEAAEATGNMEEILNRLASFAEHEAEIKQKLASAMTYPLVLTVLGLVVTIYTISSVLPTFVQIFLQAGVPLPLPTAVLYSVGMTIRKFWLIGLIAFIGLWFGLKQYGKTTAGRYRIDLIKLRLPIWGTLIRKVTIARFARTLGTLLHSGVPLLKSIDIVQKTMDCAPIAKVMDAVKLNISQGESISAPLRESGEFPPMPCQMISIGEESGTMDKMLSKIADFYELSADYTIKRISILLEPLFLVVIGGLVGFIFASIILPIFSMVKTLRR